MDLVDMNEVED